MDKHATWSLERETFKIGPEGARCIANALQHNSTLQELNLDGM